MRPYGPENYFPPAGTLRLRIRAVPVYQCSWTGSRVDHPGTFAARRCRATHPGEQAADNRSGQQPPKSEYPTKMKMKKGRDLVPESQAYMDLLAFERKLDTTIMRKRLDIQEALKRPMKQMRELRIFISTPFIQARKRERPSCRSWCWIRVWLVCPAALWQYSKTNKLQDSHVREYITCDKYLEQIFICQRMKFAVIPQPPTPPSRPNLHQPRHYVRRWPREQANGIDVEENDTLKTR
ncbi:brg-1 associated factor [Culex quinquefasciatus]|uniref:Brg-1 associated factor n=1 Tax=Culex quinquefasciatus TaxID=7176 RepID=B0XIL9_CULQU|nr:brg-1 associated factor [Culex quinquefasciatus]|eukprot:XP_001869491.1 brg-1 associated factor [Culex quinquefasciatus]